MTASYLLESIADNLNSRDDTPKICVLANGDAIDLRTVRGVGFEATHYAPVLDKTWPATVRIKYSNDTVFEMARDSDEEAIAERDRIIKLWQESANP